MDPNKQELWRQVFNLVRDDLQGGGWPQSGVSTPQQRRQQALLKMLQTGDDPIKWIAAKELGQIGDLQAAEALGPLTMSPNRDVSAVARDAIRRIQERQVAPPPPPPPVQPRATMPPPPPPPRADAPRRAVPPPPPAPPPKVAELVEAHMGRSRDTRMTKGQDLPVPPTEAQLGESSGNAPTALAGMGLALGALPALASMAEELPAVPAMAPPSTSAPDLPAMADLPGSVVDYSALGIPKQ